MAVPKDRSAHVYLTVANKAFIEKVMSAKNITSKSAGVNKAIEIARKATAEPKK